MTGIMIRGTFGYRNTYDECQVQTEAEIGAMHLPTEECQGLPVFTEASCTSQALLRFASYYLKLGDRLKADSFSEFSEYIHLANTLLLDLQTLELWGNKLLLY